MFKIWVVAAMDIMFKIWVAAAMDILRLLAAAAGDQVDVAPDTPIKYIHYVNIPPTPSSVENQDSSLPFNPIYVWQSERARSTRERVAAGEHHDARLCLYGV